MSYLLRLVCVVFFFKQKTAYEMRISDWSSDVCSSDLMALFDIFRALAFDRRPGAAVPQHHAAAAIFALGDHAFEVGIGHGMVFGAHRDLLEIGRASCRERGCQYV